MIFERSIISQGNCGAVRAHKLAATFGYDVQLEAGQGMWTVQSRPPCLHKRTSRRIAGYALAANVRTGVKSRTMPAPRIFRVIVPVFNLEEAAAFYSAVLGSPGVRVSSGRHYFGCGDVILACFDRRADGDPWDATPNPDHIYFSVDDLDEYFRRVTERHKKSVLSPLEVRPWGERSFYCTDPLGNKLCFVDEKTLFTSGLLGRIDPIA